MERTSYLCVRHRVSHWVDAPSWRNMILGYTELSRCPCDGFPTGTLATYIAALVYRLKWHNAPSKHITRSLQTKNNDEKVTLSSWHFLHLKMLLVSAFARSSIVERHAEVSLFGDNNEIFKERFERQNLCICL